MKLPPIVGSCEADVVMVDTAIKDGTSIFDHLKFENLQSFVSMAREHGLLCAIAGNLGWKHVDDLKRLSPDIIGVRSAVCEAGRDSRIRRDLVRKLKSFFSQ